MRKRSKSVSPPSFGASRKPRRCSKLWSRDRTCPSSRCRLATLSMTQRPRSEASGVSKRSNQWVQLGRSGSWSQAVSILNTLARGSRWACPAKNVPRWGADPPEESWKICFWLARSALNRAARIRGEGGCACGFVIQAVSAPSRSSRLVMASMGDGRLALEDRGCGEGDDAADADAAAEVGCWGLKAMCMAPLSSGQSLVMVSCWAARSFSKRPCFRHQSTSTFTRSGLPAFRVSMRRACSTRTLAHSRLSRMSAWAR